MSAFAESREFSGTMPVRGDQGFDIGSLQRWAAEHVSGLSGSVVVEQFKGGQSNPSYLLTAGNRRFVLRRKPPGKLLPSAHAVDREYRVMAALGEVGFPVPKVFGLCTDESVIGTPFYVMDYVDGRIFWNSTLPDVPKGERRAIYAAMNETLARLHTIDPGAVGLSDFGRPGNYLLRQIDRWSRQYRSSETETIEAMDRLIDWLPRNAPEDAEIAVVHGDYRLDNMIFHPTEPRVVAVLDWELSTIGSPLGDFAYHLMTWRLPHEAERGLGGLDLDSLGIPGESEYVNMYARATGRAEIPSLDFYVIYNLFRAAGISQGILGRVRDGTAASLRAEQVGKAARQLAETAWRLVEERQAAGR
jgi:aminoglycoside phosphotransferase (APT) family kinase protein